MELKGKRIWITGAGSGIGEALARELAKRGAQLGLTSRRPEPLEKLAEALQAEGCTALAAAGDVTDLDQMKRAAAKLEWGMGGIDVLIANAGVHIDATPGVFNSAEYQKLMGINYGGMLNCIEAALPGMLARGSGTLVGMASLAGLRGLPRAAAYGASKAAMIHFLESQRFQLRGRGVGVVVVNPGFVKTPLTDKNEFHMPWLISAERAAGYICDGLARGRSKITFPPPLAWLLEVGRVLPFPVYDFLVSRVWGRMKSSGAVQRRE